MCPIQSMPAEMPFSGEICDLLAEGILIIDRNGKVLWHNRTLGSIPGIPSGDLRGADASGVFDACLLPLITDAVIAARVKAVLQNQEEGIQLAIPFRTSGNRERLITLSSRKLSEGALAGTLLLQLTDTAGQDISEDNYRLLFETMRQGVVYQDADGKILSMNPAAGHILGKTPGEFLGRTSVDEEHHTLHEDGSPFPGLEHPSMVALRTGQEVCNVVMGVYNPREHCYRWISICAMPLYRPGENRPYQVYTIFDDITERRRSEEALRESEEKYARFFWDDLTGDSLVSVDGRILACNPAFLAIFGFTSLDEALASNIQSLYPDPQERTDLLNRLRKERTLYHHTMTLRRRDGRRVDIVANMVGIFDDAGELVSTRAYMYDDTDRKRAENILKESEERYRILVELSPEAILLHQDEGYTYANPAAIQLFRASSPEDFADKRIFDLVHPDYHALVDARNREILTKLNVPPVEIEIVRFDGQKAYVESSRAQIRHRGRPASIVVMRDITRRKQAEEALRRRTDELTHLNQKLEEARDEANLYLDILTHDVRNANNISTMYADLMLGLLEGDLRTYAQRMHDSIWRSTEILRNVATIRRIHQESASLSPVSLDTVIREEVANFPAARVRYDGPPVSVCADGLLSMIFTNLIGNAAKFGGPNVEIAIVVEEQDGGVLVTVADTGPGIPDEVKRVLFQRFERGLGQGKGEGLGLYIVRSLVERYGGRVRVEDRVPGHPEEGAAFRFTLKKAGPGSSEERLKVERREG